MRQILLPIALLLVTRACLAQLETTARLDSTSMLIGDQMKLHLRIEKSPDTELREIDLSVLSKEPKIEILNVSTWDTLQTQGKLVMEQFFTITSFDSGQVWIPAIPVTYEREGKIDVAQTNRLPLEVKMIETDSAYLAPIKPILEEPFKIQDLLPYLLGLLIIGILGAGAYLLFRRREKPQEDEAPPIVRPAHEIALTKLRDLKDKRLWQQGQVKAYQSELTYIVREYLENRYGIQALESTTDEILEQLAQAGIPEEFVQRLKEMLTLADLVKFAKATPSVDIHDKLMGYAEDFVFQTREIKAVMDADVD